MKRPPEHNSKETIDPDADPASVFFDYIRFPECKRLINRVYTLQQQKNVKSIVVLSQFSREGKTMATSILALGFMRLLEKRVLIMDTVSQTRDESFYYREILGANDGVKRTHNFRSGSIDLITTKNIDRENFEEPAKEAAPQVDPIVSDLPATRDAAGVPSVHSLANLGASAYDSADFQVNPFIDSIKDSYDLILMDTCALTRVSKDSFDPIILAQHADASIVIASPASLQREALASLTSELRRHRITPLGIISNPGAV